MSSANFFETTNNQFRIVKESSIIENKLDDIYNSIRKEIERLKYEIYKLSSVPKEKMYGTPDKKKSRKRL